MRVAVRRIISIFRAFGDSGLLAARSNQMKEMRIMTYSRAFLSRLICVVVVTIALVSTVPGM